MCIRDSLYIDVPQQVQDEQITVLAVLLDGPIKLYRGVGPVSYTHLCRYYKENPLPDV